METATVFIVGHYNDISRGALLLVSDVPTTPDGVKTEASDKVVNAQWTDVHLELGIESLRELESKGETIKHFRY
jgi:AMP nucleosidase